MSSIDGPAARAALEQARRDRSAGVARARRPGWYHPALGLSMALALASFSLGRPEIGVPLGLVIGPVALELLARRRVGASPLQDHAGQRRLLLAYVGAVLLVAALGVGLERLAGLTGAATLAGLVVAGLTVVAGRAVERRRLAEA